jgi:hypothetical protein
MTETYTAAEHLEEGDVLPTHNSSEVSESANENDQLTEFGIVEDQAAADIVETERTEIKTPPTRRRDLAFNFYIGKRYYQRKVSPLKFAAKKTPIKLMLAVGQATRFEQTVVVVDDERFEPTDEQYMEFIHTVANKGLPGKAQMTMKKIKAELKALVENGYAQNGGPRYRLTPDAFAFLMHDDQPNKKQANAPMPPKEKESLAAAAIAAAKKAEMIEEPLKPEIIPISPLPTVREKRIFQNEEHGDIDRSGLLESETIKGIFRGIGYRAREKQAFENNDEVIRWVNVLDEQQNQANAKTVKEIGYRVLEVLAELELANGIIHTTDGNFIKEIRIRVDSAVSNDSYKTPFKYLEDQKAIKFSKDNKSVILTEYGVNLISLIKAYPDMHKAEVAKRFDNTTTRHIIEHILEKVGITLSPEDNLDDLPEHSPWYVAEDEDLPLSWKIASALDKPEDNIARRLTDMRAKGYVELEMAEPSELGGYEFIGKGRITKSGMQFDIEAQRASRLADEVIEDAVVEEAEELREACMNYALTLNKKVTYNNLNKQRHAYSLFELKPEEFEKERLRLEKLLTKLRHEYRKRYPLELAT